MNQIKIGQYWLVENGCVALVVGCSSSKIWPTNRVNKNGSFNNGVGVAEKYFEKKISPEEAKNIVMAIHEKNTTMFLEL